MRSLALFALVLCGACDSSSQPAQMHYDKLVAQLPQALRPVKVEVHESSALLPLSPEYDPKSNILYLPLGLGKSPNTLPGSIWLHEIAHARLQGARPQGSLGQRLFAAVDEGVADYFSAVLNRSPQVGGSTPEQSRDLSLPVRINSAKFSALALPQVSFDEHRVGSGLAHALWMQGESRQELLLDLVLSLSLSKTWSQTKDTPQALVTEWVSRVPARSRKPMRAALKLWLPSELWTSPAESR